jgi:hypothetical protein
MCKSVDVAVGVGVGKRVYLHAYPYLQGRQHIRLHSRPFNELTFFSNRYAQVCIRVITTICV